jgi:hypothetical protein
MQWQPPVPVPPIVYSFVMVNNGREVKIGCYVAAAEHHYAGLANS